MTREQEDLIERAAWARLARATEEAIVFLGDHPRRADFVEMWTGAQRAAGPRYVPLKLGGVEV
jgi:hypothetical protein